jgi:aspartate 1-decarboxylase
VIRGSKGSGEVTLNGPAARRVHKGDMIIIIAYASMSLEEARNFKPTLLFPDEQTNLLGS